MATLLEKYGLYRAIGEMSYLVAKTDGAISKIERLVFQEAIKEELDYDLSFAKDAFEALDNHAIKSTNEEIYNRVIFAFRKNKSAFTKNFFDRFVSLLEKVASVSGITEAEIALIEQFKADTKNMISEE